MAALIAAIFWTCYLFHQFYYLSLGKDPSWVYCLIPAIAAVIYSWIIFYLKE